MCYHIIEKHTSMRSGPALKRCFRSRKTAETTAHRGATGDRAGYHLDATRNLGVVACYDADKCECARWPQGHNAEALPTKPTRRLLMCERCAHARRAAVEFIDPKTEEPRLYCQRCAERAALGYIFKRQLPQARRVHADDPALTFVAVSSDGGFLPQPTPDAAR